MRRSLCGENAIPHPTHSKSFLLLPLFPSSQDVLYQDSLLSDCISAACHFSYIMQQSTVSGTEGVHRQREAHPVTRHHLVRVVSWLCMKFGKKWNGSMKPEFFLYSNQVKNMEHFTIFCKYWECSRWVHFTRTRAIFWEKRKFCT